MVVKRTMVEGDAQTIKLDLHNAKVGEVWEVEVLVTSPDGKVTSHLAIYKVVSRVKIKDPNIKKHMDFIDSFGKDKN